ncbi:dual specificity phosphatase [Plectosphaerella plurivora]|uniref:phosphatidylinositol-3,4,5-trisphosphate 3-phosphatase n=1 Tax=Plectosphaerella plurivora TaxID=936078 RepID=A0A9P8V489_9PEZI|nr:dual specificity phosphatase [Plectosphaerella plurivora]
MASLLRQLVAGPRAWHTEVDLDLCYVTEDIIATSGPSQTWPQLAYRNPLDKLVGFLDSRHGENWAIWEFRAEGTGYPDDAVYDRIRHYPWPDHHPPPFRLVPLMMASMRNWLHGGALHEKNDTDLELSTNAAESREASAKTPRVVVVHCKAGKGRSGTVTCSYLISECGWRPEEALTRFTERRMRPKFGAGVSIPSQLRTISYVDRWTRGGKRYIDRPIEIVEIHIWGLRNGVKVDVEGFADEGRRIAVFHTFKKSERMIVEGNAPETGGGVSDIIYDLAGVPVARAVEGAPENADYADATNLKDPNAGKRPTSSNTPGTDSAKSSKSNLSGYSTDGNPDGEPGGMAVILKPTEPITIPNSDINISVERRNRSPSSLGFTMVTAVAHVWFNAFFEGNGPEQDGKADASGVFSIDWDAMDGIKGSSRKGARALDRIAVVWRVAGTNGPAAGVVGEEVVEPAEGKPVPQMPAADWKGGNHEDPDAERGLGLRVASPSSADVSKASSVKSQEIKEQGKTGEDGDSMAGVRVSGPSGEEGLGDTACLMLT